MPRQVRGGRPIDDACKAEVSAQIDNPRLNVWCNASDPTRRFVCTRDRGHKGQHIACGFGAWLLDRWGWVR